MDGLGRYDVAVFGGGPGGLAAACGAARAGAKTLLVERYGFLGGAATNMLVFPFMTFYAGSSQIIFGPFQELIDRMLAKKECGAAKPSQYHVEAFKKAAEDMAVDAGVELLYHTMVVGAETVEQGSIIKKAVVAGKSGIRGVEAGVYVDGTGDADLSAFAGAQVEVGRPEDGLCQPMTMNFRMAGVDVAKMPPRDEVTALYLAAKAASRVDCPREDVLLFFTTEPGVVHFNTSRVIGKSAIVPEELTQAEMEGRRQVWELARFLREEVPGFADSYLSSCGVQIGVRESRRVMGEHVLTADELLAATKFEDAIANGSYPIDIHNPSGSGTVLRHLPAGEHYTIPYRSIVPRVLDNLVVAGRPISATHEAHSAIRVIPIATAIGHAAGVAAALSARRKVPPRSLSPKEVVAELNRQDARLNN